MERRLSSPNVLVKVVIAAGLRSLATGLRSLATGDSELTEHFGKLDEVLSQISPFATTQQPLCYELFQVVSSQNPWKSVSVYKALYLHSCCLKFLDIRVASSMDTDSHHLPQRDNGFLEMSSTVRYFSRYTLPLKRKLSL